ncbi:MAG TPA: hypothetical protein EYP98_13235 [Planctomycetes bacterium]|nr:hypothetical protein [Planctomycetota bacterium]
MDRSHSCSSSRQTQTDDVELHREVLVAFLDHLRGSGLTGDLWNYAGAARHFLFWLAQRSIPLANVDDAVVRRFAHHRCHCRNGYRPQAITNPLYLSAIRRFVRFAEDRGDISIDDDIGPMSPHLAAFADAIANLGYSDNTLQRYRSEAEHFAAWMRLSRRRWCEVDTSAVRQFALHDCHCPIRRKRARLSPPTGATRRKRGAFRLIKFLRENGTLPTDVANPTSGSEEKRLNAYCEWLTRHRGASKETIRRYTLELTRCISELGSDSTTYDVESIRNVVIREEARRSRKSAQMTATALRSYLRFLIAQGECRPELLSAVPTVRRWRLATLPRCASPDVI